MVCTDEPNQRKIFPHPYPSLQWNIFILYNLWGHPGFAWYSCNEICLFVEYGENGIFLVEVWPEAVSSREYVALCNEGTTTIGQNTAIWNTKPNPITYKIMAFLFNGTVSRQNMNVSTRKGSRWESVFFPKWFSIGIFYALLDSTSCPMRLQKSRYR
jgi:hypothetical protein